MKMDATQYKEERKGIDTLLKEKRGLAKTIASERRAASKATKPKTDEAIATNDMKLLKDIGQRIDTHIDAKKDVYDSNLDIGATIAPFEQDPEVMALSSLRTKVDELASHIIATQTPLTSEQRRVLADINKQINKPQVQKAPKLMNKLLGKAWDILNNAIMENAELVEYMKQHPEADPEWVKSQWAIYKKQIK
jgi:hypothetical protein